nr:MAG TPA: hypothetical protein [Caudoviricetes sp.]
MSIPTDIQCANPRHWRELFMLAPPISLNYSIHYTAGFCICQLLCEN